MGLKPCVRRNAPSASGVEVVDLLFPQGVVMSDHVGPRVGNLDHEDPVHI